MIKYIIIALLSFCTLPAATANDVDIKMIRTLYVKAGVEESANVKMCSLLNDVDFNDPLLFGYRASAMMIMAKYASNPLAKLSHFNKGKRMLEQAIALDSKNIELRLLRFMAQSNAPAFLRYSDKIDSDKEFIIDNIQEIYDIRLKQFIIRIMSDSKFLEPDEKLLLGSLKLKYATIK